MNPKYKTLTFSVILTLLGIIVFGQLHNFEFVQYDDPAYITENKYVNQGITTDGLKWAVLRQESGEPLKYPGVNNLYQPLSLLSHMLDVELFGIKNPGAHHLINLLIHLISTIFCFLFIKTLTRSHWIGFGAAALFLLHPTHVESVAWLSERKDTLSGLFFWATLYFYFSRKTKTLAYTCFILGLLAKPSIVVLPVILILTIPIFTNKKISVSSLINLTKQHWHWFLASLVFGLITVYTQSTGTQSFFSDQSSLTQRISTAGTGYWFYLYRTLIPLNLSIDYTAPNIGKLHLLALLAVIILCSYSWSVRNKYPHFFLAVAWFTICWLPVSGLTYIGIDFTADRYLYLSLGGFFILIARYLSHSTTTKVILTIIIATCGYLSYLQTAIWKDTKTLYTHATKTQPNNMRGWTNLGAYYQLNKQYHKAIECHQMVSQQKKDYITLHNLGICYAVLDDKNLAKSYFHQALETYPAYYPTLNSLTKLIETKNDFINLSQRVNKAHQISPNNQQIQILKQKIDKQQAILNQ